MAFRQKIESSSCFDSINKLDHDFLHWQLLSVVCPLRNHVTLLFSHQSFTTCKDVGYGELGVMERDISVRPTKMTRPVNVDYLQRWYQIGAIHSTKIQTGPTEKRGPPQKVDLFFSKLFRLDRTDPLSFGPKFPEILVEWIAPNISVGPNRHGPFHFMWASAVQLCKPK